MSSVKGMSLQWPKNVKGLKVIGLDSIPELDADKVPIFRSGAGTDSNGEGRSVIE